MKEKFKKTIGILLPLLLGVFLVYYAYNKFTPEQLDEMKSYFRNANYNYILISTFFSLVSLIARGYRWRYSLEHMGYFSPFKTNLAAVCIGYLMNLTIPRSGEVSRALIVKKYKDVPFDKAFGSIIAERVIDLVILLALMFTALLLQFDNLKTFLEQKIPVHKLILMGTTGVGILIALTLVFLYSKWRPVVIIKQKISGLIEGVLSVFRMPHKWAFLFYTAVIWIGYVLTFYFAVFAIKETSTISFGVVVTAFVVGSLAISFTNGGFGAFPLLISEILLLYSVPETAGTTFGWILWTSQTGLIILMGLLSFLLLPLLHRNK
ncbi:flippase-like domain-containing protein [Flavobacterium supellecticarium]|uniref:Flippase-like domain-containing protein n=1 Tax=Flavobacterium supellecticarium TaxID=2565924 RepID=A0A4S3ZRK2_9FLAO|nr:lysylphosphatidylglycerol synthase transmembrane domain-containing protein [Flavobacterium supellecticarium]THF48223.1 flippase-like domain-containing protein [Flavobacterium supellecticarium]